MNQEPIARVKLATGQIGWFDNLCNINLTKAKPIATLYRGGNLANVKKAIEEGKLVVLESSVLNLSKSEVID